MSAGAGKGAAARGDAIGAGRDAGHEADMAALIAQPAFRRFLFRMVTAAGLLSPASNGADGRNLDFHEGRRSLMLDLLRDAEAGQAPDRRHPGCIATLAAVLAEAIRAIESNAKEKKHGRGDAHSRYDDIDG